ncbi:MAG: DNA polymerase III subunit delta' [Verrucomicrobiae bacterium]|nr:DNA polymerase III subunit delta' [Verrucomicrobiae bacterium]
MPLTDIPHQPAVIDQLQRTLKLDRLAHAYLFVGENGVGKELTARRLAQAVNCLEQSGEGCGQCDSCRRIEAGDHPDVYWVRPESKSRRILTEQMRGLEKAVYQKPLMGRKKVGILVDADCLQVQASNAFLKTLEEPPANSLFLLLTESPEKLLDTIVSRCRRVNFGTVLQAETGELEREVLKLMRQFPGGKSVLDVYALLAGLQSLMERVRQETEERVREQMDFSQYRETAEKSQLDRMEEEVVAQVEAERRRVRERILKVMYTWSRDILMCVMDRDALVHADHVGTIRERATGRLLTDCLHNLQILDQLAEDLGSNAQEALAFEVALLKFH